MIKSNHLILVVLYIGIVSCASCQNKHPHPSSLQYPVGYPGNEVSALQQLQNYPLPRYLPGNHLLRLFNWTDPGYLGLAGQPGVTTKQAINNEYLIQKELATEWNYGIVIPNSGSAFNRQGLHNAPIEVKLANEYPGISLDVITFWAGVAAKDGGYPSNRSMIGTPKVDAPYSVTFNRDGTKNQEIMFNFPDSLIRIDGTAQKLYLSRLLNFLTRPINRINENGEEPPGPYLYKYIWGNSAMIHMKDSMKIKSWPDFAATRKMQMRNVYSSTFMKGLPGLQNTSFSFYAVDGGPIDRFNWHIMKKCMTPINGIYYSTPDFYPRWPKNWKDWEGAWHGWRWIEIGRKTEIKDGDYLFSPFVAAGWSKNDTDNITPGQWLGLLKSLSVIGAGFYYVGYFNLSPPFNKPSGYIWQTAIPAYAQAITSRFEDVLKNGNVLFDKDGNPIINYPAGDKHVLITARKANNKEKYVICGTYQPFSNDSDEIPEKKNISVTIDGHNLSFEVRRQGSVYIYEKTPDNRIIFYQLDKWHEDAHPDHWSKDFDFEAEVADSGITSSDIYTTTTAPEGDYTNYTSYINLAKGKEALYHFGVRDSLNQNRCLWIYYEGKGTLQINLVNANGDKTDMKEKFPESKSWIWKKISIPQTYSFYKDNALELHTLKGDLLLDKFVITTKESSALVY